MESYETYLRAIGVDAQLIEREVRDLEIMLLCTGNTEEKVRA